jgi:hypothetical protein
VVVSPELPLEALALSHETERQRGRYADHPLDFNFLPNCRFELYLSLRRHAHSAIDEAEPCPLRPHAQAVRKPHPNRDQ